MRSPVKCALADALMIMMPGSVTNALSRIEWHSATFAGQRLVIEMAVRGTADQESIIVFRNGLPMHEFELKRGIVADILVTNVAENYGLVTLTIEALVLDS
jgi:hypothetical protein